MQPRAGARIHQIHSAADWVGLVDSHPLRRGSDGAVAADWRTVAANWDGVHFGLPAVLAVDGLRFPCALGTSVPLYLSVECTLWFRWVFTDVTEVPAPAATTVRASRPARSAAGGA